MGLSDCLAALAPSLITAVQLWAVASHTHFTDLMGLDLHCCCNTRRSLLEVGVSVFVDPMNRDRISLAGAAAPS